LCLSAGRVEPATVVDHILPLAEGGTHATDNLMPLCKRCHDAIKTPADNAQMARAVPCLLKVTWPTLRSAIPCNLNGIEMRFSLAGKVTMDVANQLTAAAVEGIARSCKHGLISSNAVSIVIDDSGLARRLAECYGCEIEEINTDATQEQEAGRHSRWIEAFRSTERAKRSGYGKGTQADRAGADQ
jgi:hypothetical protein